MPSFQTRADDGSGGGSGSSPSRFLSASTSSPRKSPSKQSQSISRNRSSGSLRGASLAQSMDDDTSNSRFSLAHELAAALMPEPSASSKLLAEEFGIEYDEGAEGIDGDDVGAPESESFHEPGASLAQELDAHSFGHDPATAPDSPPADDTLDPTFGEPTPTPRSPRRSEQDAMAVLSNDLETTDKLLADLRRLDAESSSQPALERLALDWIRRIDDTVRDREGQVRELLEYEREFRKISAEVGGSDALAVLPTLEDSSTLIDEDSTTAARSGTQRLQAVQEDGQEWDAERTRRGEEEDEDEDAERDPYGEDPQDTPVKDSFTLPPPPPIAGPLTPGKTIPQLTHLRTSTTSLVSSLVVLSEHAQVNGAATTEAGRKIRALKNKLGGWRTDWDSAERSRLKIERWEEENSGAGRRMDGRKFVEEHLRAFELALSEANVKTQAIMAAS